MICWYNSPEIQAIFCESSSLWIIQHLHEIIHRYIATVVFSKLTAHSIENVTIVTEILKIIHYFVKADTFQFSTDINAGRTDAEDAGFLEAVLGVHRPDSHSGGQRRRNHDGDDIQRPQYHLLYSSLKYEQNTR